MKPENLESVRRLSPAEEGLLFETVTGTGREHVRSVDLSLRGPLDVAAWRRAWESAAARHRALRTTFHWQDLERPFRVVHRQAALPWQEGEESEAPELDLAAAPLRLALVRESGEAHRFVWSWHRLVLDDADALRILDEVREAYGRPLAVILNEVKDLGGGETPAQVLRSAQDDTGGTVTPVAVLVERKWRGFPGIKPEGDGLLAQAVHPFQTLRLLAKLRELFGVELAPRELAEEPTVAGLARRVERRLRAGEGSGAPPVVPMPRPRSGENGGRLPASFSQERLWFLDQLEPGSAVYNMPTALRVTGPLDIGALARALAEIERRHEALRTVFSAVEGSPLQVVLPPGTFRLREIDLTGLEPAAREARLRALATGEAAGPFDLARGPLWRATLLRLGPEEHAVLITLHHVVGDGWSTGVLIGELTALYGSRALPELPVQYADYAVWQRWWLQGEVLRRELDWWRGELAGAPASLDLPADRPRPAVQSHRGALRHFGLPRQLSDRLLALSRAEGATLFMTALAAFQALLSRWSGQLDVSVGTPVAGRRRVELEPLIGLFVNTLVMRADLGGDPAFRELLARVRRRALGAQAHQELPFDKLVAELEPERSLSRAPLFQVMLVLQNAPAGELEVRGLRLAPVEAPRETAQFDLTLILEQGTEGITGDWAYSTDLFDAATIARLPGHFETLLAAGLADPGVPVSGLPLLTPAERACLLAEWNDTGQPPERPVHELVADQAAARQDAPALLWPEGEWTYAELTGRARRLARRLRALGAGPEVPVAVCAEHSPELALALLAILESGGTYLPLDPAYPRERLAFLLEDAGAALLLARPRFLAALPETGARVLDLTALVRALNGGEGFSDDAEALPGALHPDQAAYLVYTSGSTGTPKGMCQTHRTLSYLVAWQIASSPETAAARTLQFVSPSFDVSLQEMLATWCAGGVLVIGPEEVRRDPERLAETLAERRIERIFLPFVALQQLAEQLVDAEVPKDLREVVTAGERLQVTPEVAALFERLGSLPRALRNQYGPSETLIATEHALAGEPAAWEILPPIGRPLAGARVYVVDPWLGLVPAGVPGEILVGGSGLARGYLRRPDLTAERFLPDPFGAPLGGGAGARLYRTGDLARLRADGELEFLGRADRQVKIRGFRVEPEEIEAVLARHPAVRESAVVVQEGRPGDRRLVAYVSTSAAPAELRRFARETLPEHMVPAFFVPIDALPLTPSGKVDRRALSRLAAGETARAEPGEAYAAPRDLVEEGLAGIWEEVLRVERAGAHDSFFDLGGHSLSATRVMARARDVFGVDLPLRALFETPTIAGVAARVRRLLRREAGPAAPPLVAIPPELRPRPPLSFAQRRLWFLDQLEPGSPLYNLPAALRLDGDLDAGSFSRAVGEIVRRHESLRTTFPVVEGEPVQRVHPAGALPLPQVDLAGLGERAGPEARRLAMEDAARPFDLERGPLFRPLLIRLSPDNHALLATLHHIVGDGWSAGVLVRELAALYAAFRSGRASPLPELPIQYPDFALWQRSWLAGEVLETELAWWRERLAGLPALLELPADRPRPVVRGTRGAWRPAALPEEPTARLRALARVHGTTLFMVLLAGFQTLLSRYSGQCDLAVGMPIAGRNRVELEGLIGFLVNTLVLRADLSGGPSFTGLLRQTRETALGAYAHQDLPFEKLVEELAPERSLAHTPLFQVLFALQNAPREELELPGLRIGTLPAEDPESTTAKFDLVVLLAEEGGRIAGSVSYATDLFDGVTVDRLWNHFENLLAAASAGPETPVTELPLLGEAELQQLLVEWNATASAYPRESTIPRLFAGQAALRPGSPALEWGERTLTYGELGRRASRLAHRLRGLGVGPERRVAVCLESSPEMVVAWLAVLAAGGAYVPLDPLSPPERLAWMIEDSGARVLLAGTGTARNLPDGLPLPVLLVEEEGEGPAEPFPDLPGLGPESLAYVLYTSGSTGRPKGVAVPQRAVVRLVRGTDYAQLTPEDRVAQVSNPGFDAATFEVWGALLNGGCLVGVGRETVLSPPELADALRRRRISATFLTAALFHQIARDAPGAFSTVRHLLAGGDAIEPRWARAVLENGPPERLLNGYGPTETTTFAAWHLIQARDAATVPIGRPLANARLYVLDSGPAPQPTGVPGELCIGGDGVARGYHGRPGPTAERFVPDPWGEPGDRLYRSGDLVRYRRTGELEFLGRIDRQVKVRGFRVEPGEIEAALLEHPGLQEAVVMARQDPRPGGETEKRLAAYFVAGEPDLDGNTLRRHLESRLPAYMVPASFTRLEALPLTPNGKVDRDALLRVRPAAPPASPAVPRAGAEEAVAAVWREVLGLPAVGPGDNFFDLGGHSLLLVQVHKKLSERFPRLQVLDLFRYPTVSALAAHLQPSEEIDVGAGLVPAREGASPSPTSPGPGSVMREAQASGDVAVIGMAGRFPGAAGVEALWSSLLQGVEAVRFLTDDELALAGVDPALAASPSYVRALAACDGADLFDAGFFGFTPREAEATDPQHRLFLECAWEALETAGYDPAAFGGRIGVYGGAGLSGYQWNLYSNPDAVRDLGALQARIGVDKDFLATRVSYKLGLTGPSFTVQTACSTSLVAVHLACRALLDGECDMALAGGVTAQGGKGAGYLYEEGGILSPDGHCRAFDAAARGTVPGEGAGIVLLKRLADALADGDPVDAVIKGSAINNDGAQKVGYTAPGIDGQAEVLRAALAAAGVDPRTVTYVEAHGTATPLGDPIEVAALTQVFGDAGRGEGWPRRCALGSIKTNIGHLDCAAGVAGLIKTVLALRHGVIPPSLHFERPNPRIDFESGPFYVNTEVRPWEVEGAPRRAGVSSFGIGGTNAHAVLEEAPAAEEVAPHGSDWQLLVLSARGAEALERATADLAAHLERHPELDPADVAYTLQVGRRGFDHRRAVLCRGLDDARQALAARDPRRVLTGRRSEDGSVAFLFPGQGAQRTGMGRDLYRAWPSFRAEVDRAAEVLCPHLGLDLRDLLFPPEERREEAEALLVETRFTQPALFVVEHALARLWMSWGLKPWAFLGHSAGEYVAACLAGVFPLEDALELVALRGRLIQDLTPGAMLSVPLAAGETLPLLPPGLSLASVNAADRSVVSGPSPAVEELRRRLSERGLECRPLATSHAFHSPMMDPALGPLACAVARMNPQPPRLPYLSNVTGTWIRPEEATDPAYWGRHLRETVRFADGLRELLVRPGVLLEVGPGETLTRLTRRELRGAGTAGITVVSSLPAGSDAGDEEACMLRAAGRLWLNGADLDWQAFRSGERRRRVHLPTYPFERRRYWLDPKPVQTAPAPDAARPSFAKDPNPAGWFYLPSWTRTLPPGKEAELPSGHFLIFLDEAGLGDALAARLRDLGRDVTAVPAGEVEDYDALLASLRDQGRLPRVILHLGSFGPPRSLDAALDHAFYGPLSLAQALGRLGTTDPVDLWLVSSHVHDVSGGEPLQPERALLLGPCRVIPLEMPHVTCRNLDLDAARAGRVLTEVAARPAETVIAWRGRQRWVQGVEPVRLEGGDRAPRLRQGGVYLITGGLGGVGQAVAKWLARTVSARLLLIGRTALPPREEWDGVLARGGEEALGRRIRRLRALEEAGAEVLLAEGDVSDPDHLAWARELAAERWGGVHGVIHAAGVPGGGVIQRKDRAAAAAVLAPKVQGTLALAAVFPPEELDLFVLCSSLNSVIGAFGQVDYCAANAFLDAFAAARSREGQGLTVSIAWDLWKEAGMAVETGKSRGPRLLPGDVVSHPLLDRRIQASPGEQVYLTRLSAASHWVLDEHRIQGVPVLPGTAYLELARAAYEQSTGERSAEIQATFLAPLAVPDGETLDVYTLLHRQGDRWSFRIASRSSRWREHAAGEVGPLPPGSPEAPSSPDLSLEPVPAADRQESAVMRFGPRWDNLRKTAVQGDLFLALLDLPAELAADLPGLALHPALLDLATGFARILDESVAGVYLPFSYAGLRFRRPLTPTLYSAIRRKEGAGETLRYEVTLFDLEGEVLVEIDEFAFRRVDPAMTAPIEAGGEGLTSAEGVEALRRVLAADLPQVLVSVRDLPARLREAEGLTAERILAELNRLEAGAPAGPRHARPDLGSVYAPPRTEAERRLAGIWSDLLGIDPVGIHDDFFDLGGDSVLSLRIVARARENGLILTPGLLFQKPTIAALAAELGAPAAPQSEAAAETAPTDPGSYKPTDFPDAEVSQRDLEKLLSELGGLGGTG